ncbi:hypothetical protein AB0M32_10390 [Streptomyces sp. NPDC051985]|uniref:hypothetical protein n=1 Tax=Streptomyces sp. NPDC051985 TaxID=3155807 RepID=UPI00343AC9E4
MTASVYAALLMTTAHDRSCLDGWTASAAGHLSPCASGTAAGAVELGRAMGHLSARVGAFTPLPLTALALFWLAHRHQAVYVRGAAALLLSGSVDLGVVAVAHGLPVGDDSLVGAYGALPGVRAGWYLLAALAVVASEPKPWVRVVAALTASSAVAAGVSATDHHLLGSALAVAVPLSAWYAAGRLPGRRAPRLLRSRNMPGVE